MSTPDPLSRTFAALGDPTRRAILARLARGPAGVAELASPFEMSLPAVSKHLKVLEAAGLVARGREAQFRPASLNAQPLAVASAWIDDYRRFWTDSFDALSDYLTTLNDATVDGPPEVTDPSATAASRTKTKENP